VAKETYGRPNKENREVSRTLLNGRDMQDNGVVDGKEGKSLVDVYLALALAEPSAGAGWRLKLDVTQHR